MLGTLCYGALARRIPESGGEYCFLSKTLHPAAGYMAGWISLLVGFSAPLAAAAFAFGKYTQSWFGLASPVLLGTLLIITFALIHGSEVRSGVRVQNLAVLVKVALILFLIVLAFGMMRPAVVESPQAFPMAAFGVSLVWISFSYSGWNAAVYIGGEVRNAEKNLPRALILGTLLVTFLYIALNAVFVFSAPVHVLAGKLEVGRIAANAIGGAVLEEAVAAVIALGLVSSASSLVMAGPRVYAKMADDGYLPQWMSISEGKPPRAAIALQSVIALLMLWTTTFDALLTFIGFTLGISTAATVAALLVLRRREGRALRIPGYPVVPYLFLLCVIAITGFTIFQRPLQSLIGFAALLTGFIAWLINRRSIIKK